MYIGFFIVIRRFTWTSKYLSLVITYDLQNTVLMYCTNDHKSVEHKQQIVMSIIVHSRSYHISVDDD